MPAGEGVKRWPPITLTRTCGVGALEARQPAMVRAEEQAAPARAVAARRRSAGEGLSHE